MKKLFTLFICAVFTVSTFAQEKKEPTKKETFDFIVYFLGTQAHGVNSTEPENPNLLVTNYSFSEQTITVQERQYTSHISHMDLNEIYKCVLEEKDYESTWSTSILYFKTAQNTYAGKKSEISIVFNTDAKALKLNKALNHLIKLNDGVNTSLFDD